MVVKHPELEDNMSSIEILSPEKFPFISFVQFDRSTDAGTFDSCGEYAANISIQADIFSDSAIGRMTECDTLADSLNKIMLKYGFYERNRIPTDSGTPYRITARYNGKVTKFNKVARV